MISKALQMSDGIKARAATLLGLNRTTLVEKMKREGTADLALMKSLVESPDFGMDRTREVGKWLYSIGYEVLRKMEKGELQRV